MADWDVIIIGAGPAGSVTATKLARAGHRVLVLEREAFPRFHIGESLLPLCGPVHDEVGLRLEPDQYVHKQGASFVCERSGRRSDFDFAEAMPGRPDHAWHVERATYDRLLRDIARGAGAEVRHGRAVHGVEIGEDGVTVRTETGACTARYLVDASGLGRVLAKHHRSLEPYRRFGRAAIGTHYENVSDAAFDELGPDFAVRIMMTEEAWAWIIPLPGRRLSIGTVVRESKATEQLVFDFVASSPFASRLTEGAKPARPLVTANFSFRNTKPAGSRFVCVGDSAHFLDPMFSTGVPIALYAASRAADDLSAGLNSRCEDDPALMTPLMGELERGYATFAAIIDRFYNTRLVENLFFGAPEDGELRAGVVSVLAADVFRHDNPFQEMLLRSGVRKQRRAHRAASISD